jgi:hypothetical protein
MPSNFTGCPLNFKTSRPNKGQRVPDRIKASESMGAIHIKSKDGGIAVYINWRTSKNL